MMLLVIGVTSILIFLSGLIAPGPAGSAVRTTRWVALTDGVGAILMSRGFASEPVSGLLVVAGAAFLGAGAFYTIRLLVTRKREKSVGTNGPPLRQEA